MKISRELLIKRIKERDVVLEKAIIAPNCKISGSSQIRDQTLELGTTV